MGKKIFRRPIISVSILSICLLGGFVFIGYLELDEIDIFSNNLCFETPNLATLASIEKSKINLSISYFEHPLFSKCKSFLHALLVLPISLDNQINSPIRC